MTIVERTLQLVPDNAWIGLGSGRAAQAFVRALGERVRDGSLRVQGVPTSEETARLTTQEGIPLVALADAEAMDLTVDGADEVDPHLDLIKGYGRALVREKVVAESSHRLIILVGDEKLVPRLGSRGRLPVEVTPFALPVCERRLRQLGCEPVPESMTITIPRVDARTVGGLIALFERAVGLYATLVGVNAYHQPGVEAGKKAAAAVLALQNQVVLALSSSPQTADQIAPAAGAREQTETVYLLLEHLAANGRARTVEPDEPGRTTFVSTQANSV